MLIKALRFYTTAVLNLVQLEMIYIIARHMLVLNLVFILFYRSTRTHAMAWICPTLTDRSVSHTTTCWLLSVYKSAIEEFAPALANLCSCRRESSAKSQPNGKYSLSTSHHMTYFGGASSGCNTTRNKSSGCIRYVHQPSPLASACPPSLRFNSRTPRCFSRS